MLRKGMIIRSINGLSITGRDMNVAASMIRDATGSVLIVDIGHCYCTASISSHSEGKARVVAGASVAAGASCIDHALYQHVSLEL